MNRYDVNQPYLGRVTASAIFLIPLFLLLLVRSNGQVAERSDSFIRTSSGFVRNQGQVYNTAGNRQQDVTHYYPQGNGIAYLRSGIVSHVLCTTTSRSQNEAEDVYRGINFLDQEILLHRYDMVLIGRNQNFTVSNDLSDMTRLHFYNRDVPVQATTSESVTWRNVYDGVDFVFSSQEGKLKYDIIVRAGSNPDVLKWRYDGLADIHLDAQGRLAGKTSLGDITEEIPLVYQVIAGRRTPLTASYVLRDDQVSIGIENYHPEYDIVIDPVVTWITYHAGSAIEYANFTSLDGNGNVHVIGMTQSTNFPVSTGAYQGSNAGSYDTFSSKFSQNGSLLWSTFFGGSGIDDAHYVLLDPSGNVYITGETCSSNFPVSAGCYQNYNAGGCDSYIIKLNSAGQRIFCTYLGGSGYDEAAGLGLDNQGNVFITGYTASQNFPVTNGSLQSSNAGQDDLFIAKFTNAGSRIWATYLGGAGTDRAHCLDTDSNGDAYISGHTSSANFPVTGGAFQSNLSGQQNAFILKISSSGTLSWSTYYGSIYCDAWGIAVSSSDDVYVSGRTQYGLLPVTPGAFQTSYGGGWDAFLLKFSSNGSRQWATFLGGTGEEFGWEVATSPSGSVFIVGHTESTNFPITNGSPQTSYGGSRDAFVSEFSSSGALLWSTYLGSSGADRANGVAIGPSGSIAVVGYTASQSSFATSNALQRFYGGGSYDAFVALYGVTVSSLLANAGPDITIPLGSGGVIGQSASGGVPPYSYSWSPSTGLNSTNILNPTASPTISTTYTLTVTDAASNQASDQVTVFVNTGLPLSVNAGPDLAISLGNSAQLNAVASGGYPPYSFTWSPSGFLNSSSISNPLASPTSTTNYYVTVTDAKGNTASDLVIVSVTSASGVNLNFKRITVNWPTIENFFSVSCNGQPAYHMTKQNFRLFENGFEIPDFTLWCPDPTIRCAISVSLVFDASGSMSGSGNAGAKQAGHAFIDMMDGLIDEASVIWFTSVTTTYQQMTTNKPMLHSAVDALPASGATAVWDGGYAGLTELINNGVNQCRAVILMTDGGDNSSSRQPAELIALANRHRIRIFTIGLGSSINSVELELIAQLTGGRYFQTPNAGQLAAIYQEISTIMFQGFQECTITYNRNCADGALRTVELRLNNFCGGNDTKIKTYRAPLDSSTFQAVRFRVDSLTSLPGVAIQVPLRIESVPMEPMRTGRFIVHHDPSKLTFSAFRIAGFLLDGKQIQTSVIGNLITIELQDPIQLLNSGTLGVLEFTTASVQQDVLTPLTLSTITFDGGCINPMKESGFVRITTRPAPIISLSGPPAICAGELLTLTAPAGYSSYLWSTSETSQSISVSTSGNYWVTVVDNLGRSGTSPTVTVTVKPLPQPLIIPRSSLSFCLGRSVDLEAGGGTTFVEYVWSTGEKTSVINARNPGWYWVRVKDLNGCYATSDSVRVFVQISKANIALSGSPSFCSGDSLVLTLQGNYVSQRWSTGTSGRSITVKNSGAYWIEATETNGCISRSDTVLVTVGSKLQPVISASGPTLLCPGDSVILDAGMGYNTYRWSTGATTRSIVVKNTGQYFVEVTKSGGCNGTSSTVSVTAAEPPQIHPQGPITICRGGSIELDAGAGYLSYRWNNGQQLRRITVSTNGVYAVTVTDGNGCILTSAPAVVTVVDSLRPTIIAEGPTEICDGAFVTLDAGSGYATYRWSTGQTTRKLVVNKTGVYAVTVTDQNGCAGISNPIPVTVYSTPQPVITILGQPVICDGDSVTLDAGSGYSAYKWTNGETSQIIVVKAQGSYTVTVWNTAGCDGTAVPVTVFVKPSPQKPVVTRVGNVLTTQKADYYQWFKDGSEIPGETNQFLAISDVGTYRVKITNDDGCSAMSDPFTVISTGVDPPASVRNFQVFPDPNEGTVTVSFSSTYPVSVKLIVTNLLGQTIMESHDNTPITEFSRQVDIRSAPTGVYLLRIEAGGSTWTRKIVRQ